MDSLSLTILVAAAATLVGTSFAYRKRHDSKPFPPGPPEKSLLGGNAVDMPRAHLWLRFTDWAKKYGMQYDRIRRCKRC
jgi:hypothetical protein